MDFKNLHKVELSDKDYPEEPYLGLIVKTHQGEWVCITHIEEVETSKGAIKLISVAYEDGYEEPKHLSWPQDFKWSIGDLNHDFIGIGEERHLKEVVPFIQRVFKERRDEAGQKLEPQTLEDVKKD